ncbi:MAG: cytochrome c oxidase accessory protein CcoG [Pseudobdellovibrio sp.]
MSPFAGPAEVRGKYQTIRDVLHPVLMLIFLLLPWLRIGGRPLFLFDVADRHFILFGSVFYSHEAPLLFFVLILVILVIFILTALYGRVWCGWACPQTVFLHSLFDRIERIILGKYAKRILFYKTESTFVKKMQKLLIYALFLSASWVLSHSLTAYFVGSDAVTRYIVEGPQNHMNAFIVLSILTLVLFFNFSLFREQVCIYVCPYGRFQNALIDNNSLTVFYDLIRGEPRGKVSTQHGDCIDCKMCVRACPVKIDIREGFQMECISCGKCIDACDDVMEKVKRPEGLIRYETGNRKKINLLRFRLFLYGILFVVFSGGFIRLLLNRHGFEADISRLRGQPFTNRIENAQKIYTNQFMFHIKNTSPQEVKLTTELSQEDASAGFRLSSPALDMTLSPDRDILVPAFVESTTPAEEVKNRLLHFQFKAGDESYLKTIEFIKVD